MGGSQREPTQTRGENANSTQKGPRLDSNLVPFCCEATGLSWSERPGTSTPGKVMALCYVMKVLFIRSSQYLLHMDHFNTVCIKEYTHTKRFDMIYWLFVLQVFSCWRSAWEQKSWLVWQVWLNQQKIFLWTFTWCESQWVREPIYTIMTEHFDYKILFLCFLPRVFWPHASSVPFKGSRSH